MWFDILQKIADYIPDSVVSDISTIVTFAATVSGPERKKVYEYFCFRRIIIDSYPLYFPNAFSIEGLDPYISKFITKLSSTTNSDLLFTGKIFEELLYNPLQLKVQRRIDIYVRNQSPQAILSFDFQRIGISLKIISRGEIHLKSPASDEIFVVFLHHINSSFANVINNFIFSHRKCGYFSGATFATWDSLYSARTGTSIAYEKGVPSEKEEQNLYRLKRTKYSKIHCCKSFVTNSVQVLSQHMGIEYPERVEFVGFPFGDLFIVCFCEDFKCKENANILISKANKLLQRKGRAPLLICACQALK